MVGKKNTLLRRHIDFRGGTLGDEERLAAVRQASPDTRGFAVTMVAEWANETPGSPAFEEAHRLATDWILRHKPDVRRPAALIRTLSTFFESYPAVTKNVEPKVLKRRTEFYSEFYYHAVPFDPLTLLAAGESCRGVSKTREQCAQEIPAGSQKSIALMQQGEDAVEGYITACTEKMYPGPLCQRGQTKVQALLNTGLSGGSP